MVAGEAVSNTHTRQAKRTPVTLKIKFKSSTLEQFIERYSVDVSHGGIFIRTKDPLPVGTEMRFEFQLKDATPLIRGEGTVVWTRENDPSRAGVAPGMGVRFDKLLGTSQEVLDKILAQKAARGSRAQKAAAFNELPTKVAPSPLVADLKSSAKNEMPWDDRGDATPLPKPMPFHSDVEDFPEEAFEESTKVATLDELAASNSDIDSFALEKLRGEMSVTQSTETTPPEEPDPRAETELAPSTTVDPTAKTATGKAPIDELAARRAAQGIDNSPASVRQEDDHKPAPSKVTVAPKEATTRDPAAEPSGLTPPKQDDKRDGGSDASAASRPSRPSLHPGVLPARPAVATQPADAKRKASGAFAILGVFAIAAAAAAVYIKFVRKAAVDTPETTQPAHTDTPPSLPPSSVRPRVSPDRHQPPPTQPAVITKTMEITTQPAGATVELLNTDQKGPSPLTVTLEQGKQYQVRVSQSGFVPQEVPLSSTTAAPLKVELKPMPKLLRVTSRPQGATVFVNGKRMRGLTPLDIDWSKSLSVQTRARVSVRKRGFRRRDLWAHSKADSFKQDGEVLVQKIEAKLLAVVRPTPARVPRRDPVEKPPKPDPTTEDPPKPDPPKPDPPKPEVKPTPPVKPPPPKAEPNPGPGGPKPDWMK